MSIAKLPSAITIVVALALGAVSCSPDLDDSRSQAERLAATPIIPRDVLFGNPDKVAPSLSPNGSQLAYLAPHNGVLNIWVGPRDEPAAAKPVTDDNEPISQYFWAYTNRHIIYLQDVEGDENHHAYAVDLTTGENRDITPFDGVSARIQGRSHKHPEEILVMLNDRTPQLHDLYQVNLVSGERQRLAINEGFTGFLADDDFAVRFATRITPSGATQVLRREGDGWEEWDEIPSEDSLTTNPIGFDKSGEKLLMLDSRERNTSALVEVDLSSGERHVLSQNESADAGSVLRHPTERNVQAVSYTYERRSWEILAPEIEADFKQLAELNDGDVSVVSRTLDDRTWVVSYIKSNGPLPYYLWDRDTQQSTFLFTNRDELDQHTLASMHSTVIPSRDGLNLVSYLTLPVGSDPDGDARPEETLPMVLLVHGGPWGRDGWGLNPLHQLLGNRGYAVLSVNFRGSTGLGKEFANAGDLEWGRKMHDDLIDAVDWAIEAGIADKDRVAIMGGSYGGYATLAGVTMTPDVFAAGVDLVGPSNLVTLLESIPPYWTPMLNLFKARVGDLSTEEGRAFLTERSPLTYVDNIKRPLLIGQGANDPRVNQAESDQIVTAMKEKGIPVTYALFPDEGHGFSRPENSMAFFAVAELFLAEHLGGRSQALGAEDLKGSTMQILEGVEGVKGLGAALPQIDTPSGGG